MSEQEFKDTLDPVAIVHNRAVPGGPQPAEMQKCWEWLKETLRLMKTGLRSKELT
jgi:argininosuccinate lyase